MKITFNKSTEIPFGMLRCVDVVLMSVFESIAFEFAPYCHGKVGNEFSLPMGADSSLSAGEVTWVMMSVGV